MTLKDLSGFDINKAVHAYLIVASGLLAAREYSGMLAGALICEKPKTDGEPCGVCRACKKANAEAHPDIMILGRGKVSVNDVRDLRSEAYLSANESNRKIFILEGIDCFNDASQNALLKVLEEPPAGVVFILTATSKTAVLPTVLSRACVLTPAKRSFDYYQETAQGLFGNNADAEITEAAAAYLEAYDNEDITSFPPEVFEKAYKLAIDYFSGRQSNVISHFPDVRTAAKNDIAVYLRTFMLVSGSIAVYKASGGRAPVRPCTDSFKKLCVRISAKRAVSAYELFEHAYITFKDFTETSKAQNTLYAYLSKKL